MNTHWHKGAALLAVLAATTTACSANAGTGKADRESTITSAGTATTSEDSTPIEPIELRLGTGDAKDAPAGDQIRWFAKRVDELTDGQVRIKPVYLAAGHSPDFESRMVEKAMTGDLELTLVASRVWDTVGVRTLSALNAPFLVDSDELLARVVEGPIRDDLLSGLPEVGVVGVALWPEGLRHPFGFSGPMNEPGDYEGALIRAPYSKTVQAVFAALGAKTTGQDPDPVAQRGAESAYRLAPAGTATANLVFYPKVNTLVVNAEVDASLSDEQREALSQAAEDTRAWVVGSMPSDNEAARTFCDEGGKIQSATPAQVQAMKDATEPLLTEMYFDEVTGPIVEAIADAAERTDSEAPLADCGDESDAEAVKKLNGTYTFDVTPAAARKAGVTTQDIIDSATGRFIVKLTDGTWMLHQVYATGPMKGQQDDGLGDYTVEGDRMTWYWGHEPGLWVKAKVKVLGDGSLEFSDVTDGEGPEWELMAQVHYRHWKRIE